MARCIVIRRRWSGKGEDIKSRGGYFCGTLNNEDRLVTVSSVLAVTLGNSRLYVQQPSVIRLIFACILIDNKY